LYDISMPISAGNLFVVDDEPAVREAVASLACSLGIPCECFASGEEFLEYYNPSLAGCALVDIRLQGMDGLELQERLAALGSTLPVILISGYADVAVTVRGMRNGAMTVIEKPCHNDELAVAIRNALALNAARRESLANRVETQQRLQALAPRDRQLLEMIISGTPNKCIARTLEISQRTVDRLRARVFAKMHVASAVELAQAVATLLQETPELERII
jgi:two-component system, LuxR family, response regulator FixJ